MRSGSIGYAWRGLRRSPGALILAVVTLALGIGGATAMFAVVDAVLLNPLPYANGDRLRELYVVQAPANYNVGPDGVQYAAIREQTAVFAAIESYRFGSQALTDGNPDQVSVPAVSPGLLRVLGAAPVIGRLFTDDEAERGAPVVLISERLWRARFGGALDVVGRRLGIEGVPHGDHRRAAGALRVPGADRRGVASAAAAAAADSSQAGDAIRGRAAARRDDGRRGRRLGRRVGGAAPRWRTRRGQPHRGRRHGAAPLRDALSHRALRAARRRDHGVRDRLRQRGAPAPGPGRVPRGRARGDERARRERGEGARSAALRMRGVGGARAAWPGRWRARTAGDDAGRGAGEHADAARRPSSGSIGAPSLLPPAWPRLRA